MKFKYLLSFFTLCALLVFSPFHTHATSWAYSFVVYDGYIYVVGDEYVEVVDKEIGRVTKYSDMDTYAGNFSNSYKKGTKYYSIPGVSIEEAIAVKEEDGRYIKAYREGEYAVKGVFAGYFDGQERAVTVSIALLVIVGLIGGLLYKASRKS